MDPLEEVRLKIAKVEAEISALTTEIREAEENIRHAGDAIEKQRWVKKEEQLRDKDTELLKQKNKLLDKEARLESAAGAGPSTTETGVSKVDLADQVQQMQSEIADLRLGRVQSDLEIANLHLKLDSSTRTSRTEAESEGKLELGPSA
ncbi:hypothetical protein KFL_000320180 [Klebsormidium nitens]|uniref:Uncharacterized protein n=1 Tax=Klebsormidium nitens TaxID=105231 RepID=A0A1Y1HQQ2_KLENI|nr:hypothetical protein KFL_000320180 [Klebsormidium nitens]|eukprot:GAQ79519.1 hypothetical protein KFL_000320180 [Klebsormidium nitens]